MPEQLPDSPTRRERFEYGLSATYLLLTVGLPFLGSLSVPSTPLVEGTSLLFDRLTVVGTLFDLTFFFLLPALLAGSVLVGVVSHGYRLVVPLFRDDASRRPQDTKRSRIGSSVILGWVAAYVLWLATASTYTLHVADAQGGIHPGFLVWVFAVLLAGLVLLRWTVFSVAARWSARRTHRSV